MLLPDVSDEFGSYRIDAVLGEGAFGIVFLAHDGGGRPVALKLLKPDASDGYTRQTRARFEREARILAQLDHPGVVAIRDHGVVDGVCFIAFEYLQGRELRAVLREAGRLPAGAACHVLTQVLEALEQSHRAGLIHRDLKPENILVIPRPNDPLAVKLLDFGIARGTDDGHPSLTQTGVIVGTPRYMSPEQLSGRKLTPRSDIYSLGMVAIELLAGEAALAGNSMGAQTGRVLQGPATALDGVENIGPLRGILERMTARDPDDRFATATAVLAALRPRLGPPPLSPSHREGEGRPGRGVIAGAAVAFVLLGAIVWFTIDSTPREAPGTRRNVGTLLQPEVPTPIDQPAVVRDDARDSGRDEAEDAGVDAAATPIVAMPRPNSRPSSGCGKGATPGLSFDQTDGQYVPVGYNPEYPHPVILLIRPDRQSPKQLFSMTRFAELADRERLVVLLPDDHARDLGYKVWRDEREVDDVEVFLRRYAENLCLDLGRVFVVGIADGARIAEKAACTAWATAVAGSSFLYSKNHDPGWNCGDRPFPAIWLTPTQSVHVPSDGSESCDRNEALSLEAVEKMWLKHNHCDPSSGRVDETLGGCRTWDCRRAPFMSCDMPGGYGWPGAPTPISLLPACFKEPDPDPAFAAEEIVWSFFESVPPR